MTHYFKWERQIYDNLRTHMNFIYACKDIFMYGGGSCREVGQLSMQAQLHVCPFESILFVLIGDMLPFKTSQFVLTS